MFLACLLNALQWRGKKAPKKQWKCVSLKTHAREFKILNFVGLRERSSPISQPLFFFFFLFFHVSFFHFSFFHCYPHLTFRFGEMIISFTLPLLFIFEPTPLPPPPTSPSFSIIASTTCVHLCPHTCPLTHSRVYMCTLHVLLSNKLHLHDKQCLIFAVHRVHCPHGKNGQKETPDQMGDSQERCVAKTHRKCKMNVLFPPLLFMMQDRLYS